MNNILYIGQYSEGTTSKMRADILNKIVQPCNFEVIDTHVPFFRTNQLIRSLGFRYKIGPLIKKINLYIQQNLNDLQYELIWVDKGVFINQKTVQLLRSKSVKLVHFTPDPSFTYHKSKWFNDSLPYYDVCFTTKSYELDLYRKKIPVNKVVFVTQGFDKNLHKKADLDFSEKAGLLFIGHHEVNREKIFKLLLENHIHVTLAGIKWDKFAKKNQDNKYLNYLGRGVYGDEYVNTIQRAKIAWGAISKWIPEMHTTRTFEIPACGTALLTEKNEEINAFFNEDEVIFYDNENDLIQKVKYFLENDRELEEVTIKGRNRVIKDSYDYESILRKALNHIL